MTSLALHPRQNNGNAKHQHNSGYWSKAGGTKYSNHAAERREALG